MAKILFFNPPSRKKVYLQTNVKVGAPSYPSLTLATLAGNLVKDHEVRIVDLDLPEGSLGLLFKEVKKNKPDIVASSAKTPDYPSVKKIMTRLKEKYPNIKTIVGGPHITALHGEISKEKCFDIIAIGEADTVIQEILSTTSLKNVPGIYYKTSFGKIIFTGYREKIKDLNSLPYPAWHLFDLSKYKNSRLSSRKNPVGLIETSRGCSYQCNFCSKLTFGDQFRVKNPKRVVDEMEYMLSCGFREIHIADDSFTQDIKRAKEICKEIIRRGLKFPWSLINGIRVNFVDYEFFKLARKAGCWQVGLGIESGDQEVLNKINKKTSLAQVRKAVNLAGRVGIDTFGFFIFGLSGETEKSLRRTIEFAKKLPLNIAKFDICIPYPGTRYYEELKSKGRIRSEDWEKYICHQTEKPLFDHGNLSWDIIGEYYRRAFREFYLRPSYIAQRLIRDFKRGDLFYDIKYFLETKWW